MKEYSYEGGKNNKSPLASAGRDAVITLPTDSVLLMASGGCWKYDASIDHWQPRASFTGMDKVYLEAGFSVDNTGYILGDDAYASVRKLNLWRYDAALNLSTKTNDYYPGYGFHQLKAVSLDSFACIGLGFSYGGNYWVKDFWRYK